MFGISEVEHPKNNEGGEGGNGQEERDKGNNKVGKHKKWQNKTNREKEKEKEKEKVKAKGGVRQKLILKP